MKKFAIYLPAVLFLFSLFASLPARAEDEIPNALNPEFRIERAHYFELIPYGGSYLGNSAGQTFLAGTKGYYHINNTWAVGANLGYSRLFTNGMDNFGGSVHNKNLYLGDIEAVMSNDVAMRAGKSVIQIDFYFTLGAGMMRLNSYNEPMGVIGGGAKFYTKLDWLALAVDVINYAHFTEQPGKDSFDFDTAFTGGLCFMFHNNKKNKQ